MMNEPVAVTCYSGHSYAQEPRAFTWRGERREVTAVERTWRTPAGSHFLVRTSDGARFELAYDERADAWRLDRAKLNQSTVRNVDEEVKPDA
jgi:hypothetical protein